MARRRWCGAAGAASGEGAGRQPEPGRDRRQIGTVDGRLITRSRSVVKHTFGLIATPRIRFYGDLPRFGRLHSA